MKIDRLLRVRKLPVAQLSGSLLLSQILLGIGGVVAARALGPSGRGVVIGITFWMALIPALGLLGMNSALGVRVARRPDEVKLAIANALVYVVTVGFALALVSTFVVPRIVSGLGGGAAGIARWAVPISVITTQTTEMLVAIAVARQRYYVFSGTRILLPLIPVSVAIALTATGRLTPMLMVLANVGASVLCVLWVMAATPLRELSFSTRAFLADIRFGASTALASWVGLVNARLDYALMSTFVASAQLGYYGVANNVMLVVTTIPYAATSVITPRVAALASDHASEQADVVRRQVALIRFNVRRYFVIAALGGLFLAIAAPFAVPLVYGHAFQPAVVLIWLLVPGYIARTVTVMVADGALGMRYPRVGNVAELVSVGVTVALLALLLPRYAARGAAIASTVAYVLTAITAVIGLRRVERRSNQDAPEPDGYLVATSPSPDVS
jgi:O-antigen/teichoic acid export membrane protein